MLSGRVKTEAVLHRAGCEFFLRQQVADLCIHDGAPLFFRYDQPSAPEDGRLLVDTTLPEELEPLLDAMPAVSGPGSFRAYPNEHFCGLRLYAAPSDYLLAMKLLTFRPWGTDDTVTEGLARATGAVTHDAMVALVRAYVPRDFAPAPVNAFGSRRVFEGWFGKATSLADHVQVYKTQTNQAPGLLKAGLDLFLDRFYAERRQAARDAMLAEPPPRLWHDRKDAVLGALAEHLARSWGLFMPGWIDDPWRFAAAPLFIGGPDRSASSRLLGESPIAFRRRRIFTGRVPLRRQGMPNCTGLVQGWAARSAQTA